MNDAELLSHTRSLLWRAWANSAEEIASEAAATLLGLGMLVPEGGAAELARLRAERAVTNAALSKAVEDCAALTKRVAELEAAKRPALRDLPPSRQTSRLLAEARDPRPVEDPHDSPLHHAYRVPRDLPAGGAV